jgi:NADPH2:quinone reductase
MKVVQIRQPGPPSALEYIETETPAPGPGQVLVRTDSISVNFADVRQRAGTYPWMPTFPAILGMEASGIVETTGPGVKGVKTVYGIGHVYKFKS